MSSIKLGSSTISNAKLGSTQISQIYQGSNLIWTNATTTTTTTAGASVITSGLEIYYDLSNTSSYPGSGTTLYNLQQSSYNATLSNTTFSSAQGGILQFNNGVSNSSADTGFSTNNSAFTIQFVIKYLSVVDVAVVTGKYTGGGDDTWTGTYGFDPQWSTNGSRLQSGIGNPGTSNYYLFTISTGADGKKFYTNTTLNNTGGAASNSPGGNWIIGQFGSVGGVGASFNLGSYVLYNRQLSDSEVNTNYAALFTRY
jgi:hypothetical protein